MVSAFSIFLTFFLHSSSSCWSERHNSWCSHRVILFSTLTKIQCTLFCSYCTNFDCIGWLFFLCPNVIVAPIHDILRNTSIGCFIKLWSYLFNFILSMISPSLFFFFLDVSNSGTRTSIVCFLVCSFCILINFKIFSMKFRLFIFKVNSFPICQFFFLLTFWVGILISKLWYEALIPTNDIKLKTSNLMIDATSISKRKGDLTPFSFCFRKISW